MSDCETDRIRDRFAFARHDGRTAASDNTRGASKPEMDRKAMSRPHYSCREDLAQFEPLNTVLWIFDVDRHTIWWANPRAIAFWRTDTLDELLERDFSTDSETVRTRLRQLVESPAGQGRIQETWTLYPDETPTTVMLDMQPVLIDEGRHAIMIEASPTNTPA